MRKETLDILMVFSLSRQFYELSFTPLQHLNQLFSVLPTDSRETVKNTALWSRVHASWGESEVCGWTGS